ncbi:alpha/beta hydrolase [Staphylococcus sp. 18_1_E_LY]|uniref:Alpha/beta hydrolase n=1 Tax=Staphylococcus lloydii TaxID=2781774 RepID=A0A7T1B123_9STAP|nr:alpha/beta hydrolase [Staphylococcus lloydii]MBF7020239.1 alpha/beta hydrolase [Staphylococcus lloydii]MBF7027922.1 alpha/beta hydrolase [Staphylococcus lloydii]QPM75591.1 alpha/beta hydrolase [Staphylococcus lloydii]
MNYIKHITSSDGTKLYTKVNEGYTDNYEDSVNVIIVHGLAEHLDRYDELADRLQINGFNVIRYDQRGHGRSEGAQTYYDNDSQIVEDLQAVVSFVRTTYGNNIFLIGHSMGGYTVALYGTFYPNQVRGIVTSGALTRDNKGLFSEILEDSTLPKDSYIDNALGEGVCSDKDVQAKYELDDLVAKRISRGLIYSLDSGVDKLKTHAARFVDDVLIMHGLNDGLVSYEDALQFFNEIGSTNKSLRIYDTLEHEILNESKYNSTIFEDIIDWIQLKQSEQ